MFKFLYDLLCGKNVDPSYATDVYPFVGLFTLLIAIVFCLLFYLLLGRWKPIWDKLIHWIITLIILSIIAFFFAITQARAGTGEDSYSSFMTKFAFVNVLYSIAYFFIFSMILKKASIFAKRTPF